MKRKQILATLAVATLATASLGVSSLTAKADDVNNTPTTVAFVLKDGASVRISNTDSITGMRYTISMPTEEHNALESNAAYEVSYGVLIAPSIYQTQYGLLNAENVFGTTPKYDWAEEQADGSFVYSGKNGAVVDGKQTPYRIINVSTDKLTVDSKDATKSVFYGCIYEIKDENIAQEFVGVGYMKYTYIENDTTKTEYKFVTDADNERSMAYVAQKAYADTVSEDRLDDTQKGIIKTRYLDKVANVEMSYTVENYDTKGNLINSESETGKLGTPAQIGEKAIDGYTFDADNENNVLQGTVWADGSLVLKRYYSKNVDTYLTYTDFANGDANVDAFNGWPNYTDPVVQLPIAPMTETTDALPEAVKADASVNGGALHIIKDSYLNGATTYTNKGTDVDKTSGVNILLPKAWLTNCPIDHYTAISFRVYVIPETGKTPAWSQFDTHTWGNGTIIGNITSGWQTLYVSTADLLRIATDGSPQVCLKLPLGHFLGVADMWISAIGYAKGEHTINVVDAITDETSKATFSFDMGATPANPTKAGYTFVGYTLTKDGTDFVKAETLETGSTVYAQYASGTVLHWLNEDVGSVAIDVFKENNWYFWANNPVQAITTGMWKPLSAIDTTIASGASDWSKGLLHLIQDGNYGTANDWTDTKGDVPDTTNDVKGRSFYFRGLVAAADVPSDCTKITVSIYVEAIAGTTAKYFDRIANSYVTLSAGWNTINLPKNPITGEGYFYLGHFVNAQNLYVDYIAAV